MDDEALDHVVVFSLEPWDGVWRRNQHLATRLVRDGHCRRLTFVEPPVKQAQPARAVSPGITAVAPKRRLPARLGGLRLAALRFRALAAEADVVWVNDAAAGVWAAGRRARLVYDVTDDWREAQMPPRAKRRLVRAEDALARLATTVVCSTDLRRRWRNRYGVEAYVVRNGVDTEAVARAEPRPVPGGGPHVAYIGTLHDERLDISLVMDLAGRLGGGILHLVGPNALSSRDVERLSELPSVRLHGPVPSVEVPSWMAAMDVLVCPHLVTSFTRSLDAIKAHEYLATGKPIVATPTSGFELVDQDGVWVVPRQDFLEAVDEALTSKDDFGRRGAVDWGERTEQFAEVLRLAGRV